jgi:hypothetical protein
MKNPSRMMAGKIKTMSDGGQAHRAMKTIHA